MKTINYTRQHITEQDIQAVVGVLKDDFLTQGPKVKEFEDNFASYIGSKYAVAVSNGTSALHLSALALTNNKKGKVLTTPITFAASANAILYCGLEIEFCDINPETLCIDIDSVREKLKNASKGTYQGIIPVNFAGYPINMESFRDLADEYDLWLLEDACHAPGGSYKDSKGVIQKCGNGVYADSAIFSFHPAKHIACGEGGMITTNNKDLYEKFLLLRTHGISKKLNEINENKGGWYYEMKELGYNYRLPDILCALGISQLKRANNNLEKRIRIAENYRKSFVNLNLSFTQFDDNIVHAYHLFVIQLEKRLELYNYLKANNINCQIHYIPVHKLNFYESKYGKQEHENAENYYEKCISLPMYPSLTDQEQEYIIKKVISFM